MKNSLTFLIILFTFSGLFGQTDCKVKIIYSMNKSLPPSYTFKTDPQPDSAKYSWSFGDKTYSDSPSPTHSFKITDSYAVVVKITGIDGKVCYGELKEKFEGVTVTTPVCKIPITITKSTTTPPVYTFNTTTQPEGAKYYWHFGDGGISELASPTYTYKKTNTYVINLKVVDSAGKVCYGELRETFVGETVTTPPVSTIISGKGTVKNMASTTGCGLVIAVGNGNILVPVEMVPNFLLKEGQYVELAYELLKDKPSGCSAGISAKIHKITEIVQTPVCKIPITISKSTTTPPVYTFNTTTQPEGAKYYWHFGDGGTSELASPTYTYKKTNTYVINLKVIDSAGKVCYGELRETFVGETVTTPPVSTIISGKGTVKNMASTTGCGLVIAVGNGNILVPVEMVTNFLLKEGQYVELTYELLKDKPSGCSAGISAKIHKITEIVQTPVCKAYFTATNKLWSDPSMMKKMAFANLSTGDIKECLWNFGDNTTSTELKPTHEYAAFGEYKVCLIITTIAGCKSDYCATVKVAGLPETTACKFEMAIKPKPETPNTYLFYTGSQVEIKTWSWSFGDGQKSDLKNPEHAYEKTGTYEVSCTITTAAGCTETRTIKHTVLAAPLKTCAGAINLILYDPTDKNCNGKAVIKLLDENGAEVSNVKYLWSNGQTTSTVENLCPDKLHTVQAIIEGVCQKNTSFTLLSKPIWRASTIKDQSNFTVISPVEGVKYEWDFGNGKVLTGSEVSYNFEKDGVYDVKLKAAVGADFSEYAQQVVVMNSITSTGMIDQSELKVYPNPVKDMVRINFGNPVEGSLFIEIMNMAGQKVHSQLLNADGFNQAGINVQHLKSGIYFLRLTNDQHLINVRKFVKAN